jgi:RNA polymerase sigma-70 factor (ECF subfamily)
VNASSIDSAFDARLLAELAAGDDKAAGKLFDRYGGLAYNLAARILKNSSEAEEVVQELFVRIWREAAKFDPARGEVKSYLVRMARSMAIDRLRSSASRAKREESYAAEAVEENPSSAASEQGRLVKQALSQLPEDERNILVAAYFEGYTQSELAERFGLPLGTVKSKVRQGMQKMRRRLGPILNL